MLKPSRNIKIVKNCQVLSDLVFHAAYCQKGRFSCSFDIRGYISLKAGSRLSGAFWGHLQGFKPQKCPKTAPAELFFVMSRPSRCIGFDSQREFFDSFNSDGTLDEDEAAGGIGRAWSSFHRHPLLPASFYSFPLILDHDLAYAVDDWRKRLVGLRNIAKRLVRRNPDRLRIALHRQLHDRLVHFLAQ